MLAGATPTCNPLGCAVRPAPQPPTPRRQQVQGLFKALRPYWPHPRHHSFATSLITSMTSDLRAALAPAPPAAPGAAAHPPPQPPPPTPAQHAAFLRLLHVLCAVVTSAAAAPSLGCAALPGLLEAVRAGMAVVCCRPAAAGGAALGAGASGPAAAAEECCALVAGACAALQGLVSDLRDGLTGTGATTLQVGQRAPCSYASPRTPVRSLQRARARGVRCRCPRLSPAC